MDQPKQERTLTLLYLLSGNRRLTFKDLMDGLGLSRRSLHRYLATLKGRNLLVEEYPMAAARVWAARLARRPRGADAGEVYGEMSFGKVKVLGKIAIFTN